MKAKKFRSSRVRCDAGTANQSRLSTTVSRFLNDKVFLMYFFFTQRFPFFFLLPGTKIDQVLIAIKRHTIRKNLDFEMSLIYSYVYTFLSIKLFSLPFIWNYLKNLKANETFPFSYSRWNFYYLVKLIVSFSCQKPR